MFSYQYEVLTFLQLCNIWIKSSSSQISFLTSTIYRSPYGMPNTKCKSIGIILISFGIDMQNFYAYGLNLFTSQVDMCLGTFLRLKVRKPSNSISCIAFRYVSLKRQAYRQIHSGTFLFQKHLMGFSLLFIIIFYFISSSITTFFCSFWVLCLHLLYWV